PIELEEATPVFRLLTRIRDEAHRFAISYHRKKRKSIGQKSILDGISGVGPALKKKLLTEFASLEELRHASLERLQNISGLSEKVALNIFTSLRDEQNSDSHNIKLSGG
ncbi:MAG: helix-hairpin-helix domain-containing protein, partial [Proteobacteria bacterium]|nr:helix-hairpin-helix domain-containing protein [Pseudomonadota bacterium]